MVRGVPGWPCPGSQILRPTGELDRKCASKCQGIDTGTRHLALKPANWRLRKASASSFVSHGAHSRFQLFRHLQDHRRQRKSAGVELCKRVAVSVVVREDRCLHKMLPWVPVHVRRQQELQTHQDCISLEPGDDTMRFAIGSERLLPLTQSESLKGLPLHPAHMCEYWHDGPCLQSPFWKPKHA